MYSIAPLVGSPEAITNAFFGNGIGPIFLDQLQCSSQELNLLLCKSKAPGLVQCSHSEEVGVRCPGTYHTLNLFVVNNYYYAFTLQIGMSVCLVLVMIMQLALIPEVVFSAIAA